MSTSYVRPEIRHGNVTDPTITTWTYPWSPHLLYVRTAEVMITEVVGFLWLATVVTADSLMTCQRFLMKTMSKCSNSLTVSMLHITTTDECSILLNPHSNTISLVLTINRSQISPHHVVCTKIIFETNHKLSYVKTEL